jgi:hypothetical protein
MEIEIEMERMRVVFSSFEFVKEGVEGKELCRGSYGK